MSLVPPPRKTLLEWIESDHGDTPGTTLPARSAPLRALHDRLAAAPEEREPEPLTPPPGLRLAPLG